MKSSQQAPTDRDRKRLEDELFRAVGTLRTTEELRRFFHDLATPAELEALSDRWAVVGPLKEGLPYREIHALTGVSVTTIGRVARCLMEGESGYDIAYRRTRSPRRNES